MTLHPRRLCHLLGLVSSDPAPVGVLGLVTQISPEDREENMDGSVTFRLLSDGPSFTCFPARLNEPPPIKSNHASPPSRHHAWGT